MKKGEAKSTGVVIFSQGEKIHFIQVCKGTAFQEIKYTTSELMC